MKLRIVPVLITIVVSSVVLFGGWFAYQSVAVKSPLNDFIQEIPGVQNGEFNMTPTDLQLELRLNKDASLREVYQYVNQNGASFIEDRKLTITVTNQSSELMDTVWSELLFDVAQAMETKQYSAIPQLLKQINEHYPELNMKAEIDEEHVYITLVEGEKSKYVTLPRIPTQLEVWGNEQIK